MKICKHSEEKTGKCTDAKDDGLRKGKFCDGKVTNCEAHSNNKKKTEQT